jgi:hypothetical protein
LRRADAKVALPSSKKRVEMAKLVMMIFGLVKSLVLIVSRLIL